MVPAIASKAMGWPPTVTLPVERTSLGWKYSLRGASALAAAGLAGSLARRGGAAETNVDASSAAAPRMRTDFITAVLQPLAPQASLGGPFADQHRPLAEAAILKRDALPFI